MFTERAYTHQGEFPGKEINELWQFIDPEFTHDLTPGCDAEIILEFAAFLKVIGSMHVSLQVFAVGVHGAEFLHINCLTVQSLPFQADQRPVAWIDVLSRFTAFTQDEVHLMVDFAFVNKVETAEVKSAHDFGLRKGTVFAVGESEIPALQDRQFWKHPAVDKINEVKHSAQVWGKAFIEKLFTLGDGLAVADKHATLLKHFIHADQVGIQAAEVIDLMQVQEEVTAALGFVLDIEEGLAIQHQGLLFAKACEIYVIIDEVEKISLSLKIVLE